MKASDLFATCLETEGIEYIFDVPGEENEKTLQFHAFSRMSITPA